MNHLVAGSRGLLAPLSSFLSSFFSSFLSSFFSFLSLSSFSFLSRYSFYFLSLSYFSLFSLSSFSFNYCFSFSSASFFFFNISFSFSIISSSLAANSFSFYSTYLCRFSTPTFSKGTQAQINLTFPAMVSLCLISMFCSFPKGSVIKSAILSYASPTTVSPPIPISSTSNLPVMLDPIINILNFSFQTGGDSFESLLMVV